MVTRVVVLLLLLAGCSQVKPVKDEVVVKPENPPSQSPAVIFEPINATDDEAKIIKLAEEKLNKLVSSKCFKDVLVSRKMIETNGKSSVEVYEHIKALSGRVPVRMYYKRFTSAVAYRVPPELTINLNRRFFYKSLPVCDWASTMAHEALGHALGNYGHDFNYSNERNYSVPYSLNFAVDACCE